MQQQQHVPVHKMIANWCVGYVQREEVKWSIRTVVGSGIMMFAIVYTFDVESYVLGDSVVIAAVMAVLSSGATTGQSLVSIQNILLGAWSTIFPVIGFTLLYLHAIPPDLLIVHAVLAPLTIFFATLLIAWYPLPVMSRKIGLLVVVFVFHRAWWLALRKSQGQPVDTLESWVFGVQFLLYIHLGCLAALIGVFAAPTFATRNVAEEIETIADLQQQLIHEFLYVTKTNSAVAVGFCAFMRKEVKWHLKTARGKVPDMEMECGNIFTRCTSLFQTGHRLQTRLRFHESLQVWIDGLYLAIYPRRGQPISINQERFIANLHTPMENIATEAFQIIHNFEQVEDERAERLEGELLRFEYLISKARFKIFFAQPSTVQFNAAACEEHLRRSAFLRNFLRFVQTIVVYVVTKRHNPPRKRTMCCMISKPGKVTLASLKQPFKVALAMSIGNIFVYCKPVYESLGNTMWITATIAFVMSFDVGSSVSTCVNRLLGSVVAAVYALTVILITTDPPILVVFMLLFIYFANMYRVLPRVAYGILVSEFTLPILLLRPVPNEKVMYQRIHMTSLGIVIYLVVELSLWRTVPRKVIQEKFILALSNMGLTCKDLCNVLRDMLETTSVTVEEERTESSYCAKQLHFSEKYFASDNAIRLKVDGMRVITDAMRGLAPLADIEPTLSKVPFPRQQLTQIIASLEKMTMLLREMAIEVFAIEASRNLNDASRNNESLHGYIRALSLFLWGVATPPADVSRELKSWRSLGNSYPGSGNLQWASPASIVASFAEAQHAKATVLKNCIQFFTFITVNYGALVEASMPEVGRRAVLHGEESVRDGTEPLRDGTEPVRDGTEPVREAMEPTIDKDAHSTDPRKSQATLQPTPESNHGGDSGKNDVVIPEADDTIQLDHQYEAFGRQAGSTDSIHWVRQSHLVPITSHDALCMNSFVFYSVEYCKEMVRLGGDIQSLLFYLQGTRKED